MHEITKETTTLSMFSTVAMSMTVRMCRIASVAAAMGPLRLIVAGCLCPVVTVAMGALMRR